MNIVLLTHDSVFGRYLAAALDAVHGLDRVVIERRRASWRFYRRKLWRVGPVNFAFQGWLNRWFAREGARALPPLALPAHEVVDTVDDCAFGPEDLMICFGTSYIRQRTLARAPNRFLNLHTGILPDYRGVKSEFWTLYNGDDERAGWTLHVMTPSLDGGDIVLQRRVRLRGENPAALRATLLVDAIPAIAALLAEVRVRGLAALSRRAQGEGHYYTTPTWRQWRAYRRRLTRHAMDPVTVVRRVEP
jgi:methionyl-tRNA formyltransferase